MSVEPVVAYWTLRSAVGQYLTCELVRTDTGLKVRCGYSRDQILHRAIRASSVKTLVDGQNLAEGWKAMHLASGWVTTPDVNRLD